LIIKSAEEPAISKFRLARQKRTPGHSMSVFFVANRSNYFVVGVDGEEVYGARVETK
jgi:hypothetical protein